MYLPAFSVGRYLTCMGVCIHRYTHVVPVVPSARTAGGLPFLGEDSQDSPRIRPFGSVQARRMILRCSRVMPTSNLCTS